MSKKRIAIIIFLLLLLDQVVKIWIKTNMHIGESFDVFGSWFQILFIENKGAAYGMQLGGDIGKLFLSLFRICAIGVLVWYLGDLIKKNAPKAVIVCFAMVTAGAAGNMIDSAFYGLIFSESSIFDVAKFLPEGGGYAGFLHGKVVDMLYFPLVDFSKHEWVPVLGGRDYIFFSPVFNIADSYITCAVIYLLAFERKFFK